MVKRSKVTTTYVVDEHNCLTFVEVCEQVGVSEDELNEFIEQGLLEEFDLTLLREQARFDATQCARVQTAARLRHDLGVNASGVVLALELLDEINELKQALDILSRHLHD